MFLTSRGMRIPIDCLCDLVEPYLTRVSLSEVTWYAEIGQKQTFQLIRRTAKFKPSKLQLAKAIICSSFADSGD